MVTSKNAPRYETKPLDSFAKAKELSGSSKERFENAKTEGKVLIGYWGEFLRPMLRGFKHEVVVSESYAALVSVNEKLALDSVDAVVNWGFPVDVCGYAKAYWGSMLLDKSPWGTSFPKLDVVIQDVAGCAVHNKFPQFVAEHLNIPLFLMDSPQGFRRSYDDPEDFERNKEIYIEHMTDELEEVTDWLEKKSGQRYDDERFLEGLRNEAQHKVLWSQVCILNQNIPAPLDTRQLFSLMAPAIQLGGSKEVVVFEQMLLDEVKWRVENKIAALATERCRLAEDSIPPWYAMHILRYVNKWGATFVCCPYLFNVSGVGYDGLRWVVPKSLEEEGIPMRTREDGFHYMAEEWVTKHFPGNYGGNIKREVESMKYLIQDWKCDGAMLRINTGCTGHSASSLENLYTMRQLGVPMMTYQCSQGDRRTWSEAEVMKQMERYLEVTMGLTKLEN